MEKTGIPALREIIEERKDKAIGKLSDCYAKNRLPLEEYERLVEYINKIESERELAVVEKIVAGYGAPGASVKDNEADEREAFVREPSVREPKVRRNADRNSAAFPPDHYSGRGMTVLSSRTFSGPLKPGSRFLSVLGSGHIKVRKEDLGRQRTVLNIVSILGESVVFVAPGVRVINNTIPVLGGAWMDQNAGKQARDDDPLLVISGTAILGNVTVKPLNE